MRFAKLRATSSIELIGRLGATIHLYDFSRVLGDPSQVYHLREGSDEVRAIGYQATISRICSGNHDKRPNRQASVGS